MKTKEIDGRIYTHRTRSGMPARILCLDAKHKTLPVLAAVLDEKAAEEKLYRYTSDFKYYGAAKRDPQDLLEGVEEEVDWSKVAIDTPVVCIDLKGVHYNRHFAGVDYYGRPLSYADGCTSWTGDSKASWTQMKLAEPTQKAQP